MHSISFDFRVLFLNNVRTNTVIRRFELACVCILAFIISKSKSDKKKNGAREVSMSKTTCPNKTGFFSKGHAYIHYQAKGQTHPTKWIVLVILRLTVPTTEKSEKIHILIYHIHP